MPVYMQNWDGVAPPAIPADWASTVQFATVLTENGINPTSSPNMLRYLTASGSGLATYNTPDAYSGDVVVQGNFNWYHVPGAHSVMGLTARGSAAVLDFTSTNWYTGYLDYAQSTAYIAAWASGVQTQLFSTVITGTLSTSNWYAFFFQLNGTALSFFIQDLTTSQWLNSSGVWQSGKTSVVAGTDSTITGSGYSGIYGFGGSSMTAYSDDYMLSPVVSSTTHAMMYDRIKETSQSMGIGSMLLEGAEQGFQDFSIVGNGNYVYYCILDRVSFTWEVGLGSWDNSGPYLHRILVYDGSFGPGNLVNFVFPGLRDVFNTCPSWLLNSLMGLL